MRATSWLKVNLVLYGAIACLVAAFFPELAWSARNLRALARGSIESPLENRLAWEAEPLMSREPEQAREMLERSLAIDPKGEAAFRLAQLALQTRDYAEAEGRLLESLTIDPTRTEAYLKLAWLQRRTGREEEARATLERGIAFFREAEAYRPHHDKDVEDRFNQKAARVYQHYRSSLARLEQAR